MQQISDVLKVYEKQNPQYTVQLSGKKIDKNDKTGSALTVLVGQYGQQTQGDALQRFQTDLNLYNAVAFRQQAQNSQVCQFCPKDKQSPAVYVCNCGMKFCSLACQKVHWAADPNCGRFGRGEK